MAISRKSETLFKVCNGAHLLAAILVTLLGVLVIVGWHTRTISLIQIFPTFVPMQYNTALGFLILGWGFFCLYFQKKSVAIFFGVTVAMLGLLTLIQYFFNIDLNIDEFFMRHDITTRTSHPGRMAPNTALCFLISGIAIGLGTFRRDLKWPLKTLHALSIMVLTLAAVAAIGYMLKIEAAYGWGRLTRMALHTSAGFFISGMGLFAIALRHIQVKEVREGRWLPALAGLSVLFLFFLLWQALKVYELKNDSALNKKATEAVLSEIDTEFNLRFLSLKRMVERMQAATLSKDNWEKDAELYIKHFSSLQRISYISSKNKIWKVSNIKNPGKDFFWKKTDQRVNFLLSESGLEVQKAWIDFPLLGQPELVLVLPVRLQDKNSGALVAGIDLKAFLELTLNDLKKTYLIEIYYEKELIYQSHEGVRLLGEKVDLKQNSIRLEELILEARVGLHSVGAGAKQISLSNIFLFFGLLISLAFGALVYLAQKNQAAYKLLKQQSDQLIQSEKLSALGTMAAGVAHELNNPMMGILNYVQYSIKKTTPDNRIYPVLQDAEKEIKRCTKIVSDILTFSRSSRSDGAQHSAVKLSEMIESALSTVSKRIETESVKVQKKYDSKIDKVMVHQDKVKQVLLNLVVNALDAMENVSQKQLDIEVNSMRGFACVSISDRGPGVPKDVERRIFDPFFTTKAPGKGTGLGLSICRSIVQEHGGELQFENKEKEGAIFRIFLPLKKA